MDPNENDRNCWHQKFYRHYSNVGDRFKIQSLILNAIKALILSPIFFERVQLHWSFGYKNVQMASMLVRNFVDEICWWHIGMMMTDFLSVTIFGRIFGFKNEVRVLSTVVMICRRNQESSLCRNMTLWHIETWLSCHVSV